MSYIRFRGISKRFPGVTALHDVTFDVEQGTCHAVVGENGAGKSTLGKILAGIYPHDEGELVVADRPARLSDPADALRMGIGIVHQEMVFCENLSVAENLFLGALPDRSGFLLRNRLEKRACEALDRIGVQLDVRVLVGELAVGQQQLVRIAAAVNSGAQVIVFDEPTSSLSHIEAERLFEQMMGLKSRGVTLLYISHRMEEVFRLCDRVTVLRDGLHISTGLVSETDETELIHRMIGRSLDDYFPTHLQTAPGREMLRVEGLSSPGRCKDLSFRVNSGEVLGLAGLIGAGRTETLQALFGLDSAAAGRIWVEEKPVSIPHPGEAMRLGIGLVPEDRKRFGLVLSMGVRDNISLPTLERLARWGFVNSDAETRMARDYTDRLQVRTPSLDTETVHLSGGNQQKLVLAKWLASHCRILLIDEPTRGVDVGAKAEMHALIDRFARDGGTVVLASSELPEILNLSTRILVLRQGRIAGMLSRGDADEAAVLRLMTGVS
ncbi:MAG: sugar ABC transporter ATP-binding protein [candidate division Zixibacteria bacterium]|nr:sugar ABC transporter ATP-binding protein [candidate division Zixibacteria bacterium]